MYRASGVFNRIGVAIMGITLCIGTVQAQQKSWPEVVAAAKKEGRVMMYFTPAPQALARIAAGFKRAYPDIALESYRASGGGIMQKIDQERQSSLDGADVLMGGDMVWALARAGEGRLLKPLGPAMKDWPSKYLVTGVIAIPGVEPFGIAYNKNLVTTPPKSYADLLRPEFKGKIGISDLSSISMHAYYDWLEKTQPPGFLLKLRTQNPKVTGNVITLAQSVAAGEFIATPTTVLSGSKPLVDSGAPIAFFVPSPGFGTNYVLTAFSWSQRPNAALVLMDYLMSAEGQNAWHGNGEGVGMLPGIKGATTADTVYAWEAKDYPPDVAAKYRAYWNKIFE